MSIHILRAPAPFERCVSRWIAPVSDLPTSTTSICTGLRTMVERRSGRQGSLWNLRCHDRCQLDKRLDRTYAGSPGITEALIAAICLKHGFVPGTLNCERVDSTLRSHILRENEVRPI